MIEELKSKAAEHWRLYLPVMWKMLKEEDLLDWALNKAARGAEKAIREWMDAGARLDEAEEIVLPQFIYLKPEIKNPNREQAAEEARREAEYQKTIGIPMSSVYQDNGEDIE